MCAIAKLCKSHGGRRAFIKKNSLGSFPTFRTRVPGTSGASLGLAYRLTTAWSVPCYQCIITTGVSLDLSSVAYCNLASFRKSDVLQHFLARVHRTAAQKSCIEWEGQRVERLRPAPSMVSSVCLNYLVMIVRTWVNPTV